jgi:ATP-dependent DNA ligase
VNPQFRTKLSPLIQQVKSLGLEGVVAKRSNSIYIPGKAPGRSIASISKANS